MRIVERDGVSWIDHPTNIEVSELYERIDNGESVDSIKNTLSITDPNHWHTVADAIFDHSKTQDINHVGASAQIDKINDALAPHALNVSVYGNVAEEKELIRLIDTPTPDIQAASRIVFRAVMDPRMRALQLAGRFEKIPLFREFSYFINSATISYYRGNVASALLCLVPVIEGILIRWQGFPGAVQKKPDFDKTKNFVRRSIYRNPAPLDLCISKPTLRPLTVFYEIIFICIAVMLAVLTTALIAIWHHICWTIQNSILTKT